LFTGYGINQKKTMSRLVYHCVPVAVSRRLDGVFPKDPPARIAIQVAGANAQPGRNAHFALDVIALDPEKS
jgi:hypothetical protein